MRITRQEHQTLRRQTFRAIERLIAVRVSPPVVIRLLDKIAQLDSVKLCGECGMRDSTTMRDGAGTYTERLCDTCFYNGEPELADECMCGEHFDAHPAFDALPNHYPVNARDNHNHNMIGWRP